jgi:polar amino acid transport system substrate-binding protein
MAEPLEETPNGDNNNRNILIAGVVAVVAIACAALLIYLLFIRPDTETEPEATLVPETAVPATAVPTAPLEEDTPTAEPEAGDEVWQRIQEAGRIVVGVAIDYPPFEYYTDEFRVDGFDIALISEIGQLHGLDVVVMDMSFDGIGGALLVGQIDMAISAISYTPERDAVVDFSNIYFISEDAVLGAAGTAITLQNVDDLAVYRVGVQSGTVYETWLEDTLVDTGIMPVNNLIIYQNIEEAVQDLAGGLIDLVVLDLPPAQVAVETGVYAIVAQGLNRQRFSMALPEGASTLQSVLNASLVELQNSGRYSELVRVYFDPNMIVPLPTPDPSVPTATPPPPPTGCVDAMQHVSDLTFDDNNLQNIPQLPPGTSFSKGWRVRNTGTCTWDSSYALIPVSGNTPEARMGGVPIPVQGTVQPGQEYDFFANLVSPLTPGTYVEYWSMRNGASGLLFGERLSVAVEVVPLATATPPPTQTPVAGIQFSANPTTINSGECSVLTWNTENVQAVYLYEQGEPWQDNGVPGDGTRTVCPSKTSTYELRVVNLDGSVDIRQVTVNVIPVSDAPSITRFTVDPPNEINAGQCVVIRWSVEGEVTNVTLHRNNTVLWDAAPLSGSLTDCPPGTGEMTYGITATGPGGTSRLVDHIRVVEPTPPPTGVPTNTPIPVATTIPTPAPPVIQSFAVQPSQIQEGQCVQVIWRVGGEANLIQIKRNGVIILDNAPYQGNETDCLQETGTTTYTLEASNATSTVSEDRTVEVVPTGTENPLAGTSWDLLSYLSPQGTTVPVLEGINITASFGANGELSGFQRKQWIHFHRNHYFHKPNMRRYTWHHGARSGLLHSLAYGCYISNERWSAITKQQRRSKYRCLSTTGGNTFEYPVRVGAGSICGSK